jgi:hypothetical protein
LRCSSSYNEDKEVKNLVQAQVLRSKLCAQCNMDLCEPIVACEMGNLYNKEAILTALLNKTLNPTHAHIRGMKDVKTLRLTPNKEPASGTDDRDSAPKYMCPITGLLLNGIHPFVVVWTTGWVLAEKAIREIGIEGLQPEYGPFTAADIVKLIPGEEEFVAQRTLMDARREAAKAGKKDGKKGSKRAGGADAADGGGENDGGRDTHKKAKKLTDAPTGISSSSSSSSSSGGGGVGGGGATNLTAASSLAKKVVEAVAEQEAKSNVFAGLFHKGKEADKKGNDLFMTVAGLRYSVG